MQYNQSSTTPIVSLLIVFIMQGQAAKHIMLQKSRKDIDNQDKQLNFMMKQRHKLMSQVRNQILKQSQLPKQYQNDVEKQFSQYENLSQIADLINSYGSQQSRTNDNSKFWNLNMTIQRDIEDNLRELKQMDIELDRLVNEESQLYSEQEEAEDEIRSLLTNKSSNYLAQAEPFLARKGMCLDHLKKLREEKEKMKIQKLRLIKTLLSQLQRLKQLRERRLTYCRDKKLTGETLSTLKVLLNDVINQKKNIYQNESTVKKLMKSLDSSNQRVFYLLQQIQSLSQELFALFNEQEHLVFQVQKYNFQNQQVKYLQERLMSKLQLQTDLLTFMDRTAIFIRQQQEKKKELEQVFTGVSTTNQTIKIFKHIHEAMQSQQRRKIDLLKRLQILRNEQERQSSFEDKIAEIEEQLQKSQGKRQKLLKQLSSKANQADVSAYKKVTTELEGVQTECRAKTIIIQDMKKENFKKSKFLSNEIAALNDEYSDITAEIVPHSWLKGLDFSRQEGANEMKNYLGKLYSRLKN